MIRAVVFDIDGVLTNGKLLIDEYGKEFKTIDYRDVDAIFELNRKGYIIGFITGEDTTIVQYFERRFPHKYFYRGCKNKLRMINEIILNENISADEICYIGDSVKDLEAIKAVGLGVCPINGHASVKLVAKHVLKSQGGDGAIQELAEFLLAKEDK